MLRPELCYSDVVRYGLQYTSFGKYSKFSLQRTEVITGEKCEYFSFGNNDIIPARS